MKIKKHLLLLAVFITASSFSFSQENKRHAENLFNRIFPVGLKIGLDQSVYKNSPNSLITYEWRKVDVLTFGFDYNIYQSNKFNFRIGFSAKNTVLNEYVVIPAGFNNISR